MNTLVNEELNKMKYLLIYQKGKVISEQAGGPATPVAAAPAAPVAADEPKSLPTTTTAPVAAPAAVSPATVEDAIKVIQTILNTKYGGKLTVDGKLGNLTQTALEAAVKSISTTPKATGEITPPVAPVTPKATGEITPPVVPVTPKTVIPGVPDAPNPNATPQTGVVTQDEVGEEPPLTSSNPRRDARRARQDLRRTNKREMQDLRAQQRA
jgi:hypothetical protein